MIFPPPLPLKKKKKRVSHRGTAFRHRLCKEELYHGHHKVSHPQPLEHTRDPHLIPRHCRRCKVGEGQPALSSNPRQYYFLLRGEDISIWHVSVSSFSSQRWKYYLWLANMGSNSRQEAGLLGGWAENKSVVLGCREAARTALGPEIHLLALSHEIVASTHNPPTGSPYPTGYRAVSLEE